MGRHRCCTSSRTDAGVAGPLHRRLKVRYETHLLIKLLRTMALRRVFGLSAPFLVAALQSVELRLQVL